ncbi:MAG: hypothetical protein PVH63_03760 [Balneolaceae bacterium]|jgi:hypothetical protein
MEKHFICYCLLFLLTGLINQLYGQNAVSVNIGGEENLKTVAEARSLSASNTLMPIGVGMGSVALLENNTLQKVGAAMTIYGIVMGPSTGNFYAEDYARGGLGMAVRVIGAYLMKDATSEIFGHRFAGALGIDNKNVSLTDTKILIGEGLVLGSIIYNFLSINKSIAEYNSGKKRFSMSLNPALIDGKISPLVSARIEL